MAKKSEAVQKLRSGLSSVSAEAIEQQVQRLEEQIRVGHFKLAEERRIVGEVNRLKRSRRGLAVYQKEREELEVMRGEQRVARSAREWWFGRSKEARGREEVKRGRLRVVVERLESVKRSLDELREEKRSLIADFQAQETGWRNHLEKKGEEARKREEEERRRVEEVKTTAGQPAERGGPSFPRDSHEATGPDRGHQDGRDDGHSQGHKLDQPECCGNL